ncbi:hypothetical protein [Sporisorium scitamineum]|uniref:Uncharacterized protein n=1 Tax=Sporisorium scitamineum TaxID=49012 RepID=A0A0F7S7G4_9BASI|nr:hypothetical protein [Sporisorium scitamineum]
MKCLQASLLFAAFALQCMLEVRAIGDNEVILGNDVSDKVEARHIARVFFENDRDVHENRQYVVDCVQRSSHRGSP